MPSLNNRHIVLGITGGIAAYKSPDIVRKLKQAGAEVRVVMTASAKEFITPLTLQAVSGHPVHEDLFDKDAEAAMGHIELARWADLVLIAPATANVIARITHGQADDLLTTLCLATKAPVAIAPAMNQQMWSDKINLTNIKELGQRGYMILGPAEGSQACGDVGLGRLIESEVIVAAVTSMFSHQELNRVRVLITSGPTQEAIDPVRYISNYSSGKMGFAMAQAAMDAGASVTVISGPVHLPDPERAETIKVTTAEEMLQAVLDRIGQTDIFIAVAAVCDYRVKQMAAQKIKKTSETMILELVRNPDILKTVSNSKQRPKYVVGFAAETENLIDNAKAKLTDKSLDMVIANGVSEAETGFGAEQNKVWVLTPAHTEELALMAKPQLANSLIKIIGKMYREKKHTN